MTRARSTFLLAMTAAAGIVLPPAALHGQSLPSPARRRVVLLVDTPGDALMNRIRAEVAALGLEVEPRAIDEPAVGVAPAWLVTKVAGTPIPALPDRAFALLVVTSEPTFYAVRF